MSIFTENLQGKDLTAADKYIYLFLVNNFSEAGACDLPNEKLCELLEVSLSTFRKSIKTLQEKKLVKIQRFPNKRVLKFTTLVKNTTLVIFTTPIKIYYPTESIKNLNKSESYLASWADFSIKIWELERKEAKERYIYINTYINSINININNIEGKSSLTSFASTSLKYYIDKFNFVNDPDHRNINQIQNSLIPTEPAKTSLAEIAKAPAKRKRAKAQFKPPTAEQVEEYMKQYVEKKSAKIPKLLTIDLAILSEQFIARYEDDWSEVKNWKNKTITFLGNQIIWNKNQKGYTTKRRKNQDAIEEIFGKGLEPETNIIDAVQTENADGSVLYDASSSNQITAQPAEEAELSAAEYIEKFKKGEIK